MCQYVDSIYNVRAVACNLVLNVFVNDNMRIFLRSRDHIYAASMRQNCRRRHTASKLYDSLRSHMSQAALNSLEA